MAISENADLSALSTGQRSLAGVWIAMHALVFAILMTTWYSVTALGWVDPLILPSPANVMKSLVNIVFVARTIWYHFWMTLAEGAMGFVIGSGAGFGLAIWAALSTAFRRYLTPYVVVIQVTPRIALAPIIIAWLGFGLGPIVAIAALVCFFPPFINTLTGLLSADADSRELFRSLGASKRQVFFRLMLPSALPVMMAGLKTAVSLALTGAVVGEFITGSAGLGVLVSRYTYSLNMSSAFATLIFLALIGYLLFLITEILDSYIIFWRHDARLAKRSASRAAQWRRSMRSAAVRT
jgi:NitT/TauT family transport system permease protein